MTSGDEPWALGPFERQRGITITAAPGLTFHCPVTDRSVEWAAKDVFNPGAVVHEGRVHLLVRGEDGEGRYAGVSRIGLAISDDGRSFTLEPEPVIFPADDEWQAWEWPGGCEDPRVVESPDGGYACTYTAFDGKNGTLCRRHLGRPAPLGQARPGVRRFAVREADVEERIDRDRGRRRAPRCGTTRRLLLDVLG